MQDIKRFNFHYQYRRTEIKKVYNISLDLDTSMRICEIHEKFPTLIEKNEEFKEMLPLSYEFWIDEDELTDNDYYFKPLRECLDVIKNESIEILKQETRSGTVYFKKDDGATAKFMYHPRWSVRKLRNFIKKCDLKNMPKGDYGLQLNGRILDEGQYCRNIAGIQKGILWPVFLPWITVAWQDLVENIPIQVGWQVQDFVKKVMEEFHLQENVYLHLNKSIFVVTNDQKIEDFKSKSLVVQREADKSKLLCDLITSDEKKFKITLEKSIKLGELITFLKNSTDPAIVPKDKEFFLSSGHEELDDVNKKMDSYNEDLNLQNSGIKIGLVDQDVKASLKIVANEQPFIVEYSKRWKVKALKKHIQDTLKTNPKIDFCSQDLILLGRILRDNQTISTIPYINENPIFIKEQVVIVVKVKSIFQAGWSIAEYKKHLSKKVQPGKNIQGYLKLENDICLFDDKKEITEEMHFEFKEKAKVISSRELEISSENSGPVLNLEFSEKERFLVQVDEDWTVKEFYSKLRSSKQIGDLSSDIHEFDLFLNKEYLSDSSSLKLSRLALSGQTVEMHWGNRSFHENGLSYDYEMIVISPERLDFQQRVRMLWNKKTLKKKLSETTKIDLDKFDLKISWPNREYNEAIMDDQKTLKDFGFHKDLLNVKLEMIQPIKFQYLLKLEGKNEMTLKMLYNSYHALTRSNSQVDFRFENEFFLLEPRTIISSAESSQIVIVNPVDGPIVTFNLSLTYKNTEGVQIKYTKEKKRAQLRDNWNLGKVVEELKKSLKIPANIEIQFWIESDTLNDYKTPVEDLSLHRQEITVVREFNRSTLAIYYKKADGGERDDFRMDYSNKWTTSKLKKKFNEKVNFQLHESLKEYVVNVEDLDGNILGTMGEEEILQNYEPQITESVIRLMPAFPVLLEIRLLGREFRNMEDALKRVKGMFLDENTMQKLNIKYQNASLKDGVKLNDLTPKIFKIQDFPEVA